MNYTGFILALQLCMILGFPTADRQSIILEETEKLKEYFNATGSHVADGGGSLFSDILKKWKEEGDKKLIQSQIVSFYFKLFENFTNNHMIQRSMDVIKEELFVKFFNGSQEKMNDFQKLIDIPVNDLRVQQKAISELFKVIEDLTSSVSLKKRKRSQIQLRGRRAPKN
ncbi:interferon gamma [Suncus etruscus]|uniref:interferon gamma n=1 Tax=Suncus etruscus TaxID=109475 RepID=UPI002110D16C|nr:interferon gamma [Suncus etruscus]